ncbi:succinate dehydrogenase/fumarate reductase-like Fe-S protein [Evansella vedderi]|uniref:Succinate dehydrogenase/fumarate reductase-like Fe-S protein n=1 Tax=Evansella vedderi TaxID=38282 RepID=A0ABT9ZQ92_9BACI|nr:2Fe-2S iron-sulfur cluster-binding protein [Evansella vedderi]MDQ0253408.1 succinate dehydrogenase/fumarate reductase-like Fe-S protein [Evansella vedderi]
MEKLSVKIERANSEVVDLFEVDYTKEMTVLEALEEIYRHHDPSLAYRFSCRTGLCATCMMIINGKPGLSCMKLAEPSTNGFLTLAPLPKGSTIKDLVKEL